MRTKSCSYVPGFLIGVLVFLSWLVVSSGNAAPAASGRKSTVSRTTLELSVNILGQREDVKGGVSAVRVKGGAVLQSHDNFQVHFTTNRNAYVYILLFDAKGEVQPLFPDPASKSADKVRGGVEHIVPAEGRWFWLDENTGSETISILASLAPLDDVGRLLGEITSAGKEQRKAISRQLRERIGSLERQTGSIVEGPSKSYRLKDGTTGWTATDVARGAGSAARTIRFAHIDDRAARTAGVGTRGGETTAKGGTLPGNKVIPKGADMALAGIMGKAREGFSDERKIAELLGKIKQNAALEETRGVGGIQIYKRLSPAVVLVATEDGQGSGSVIDKKGTVVTNWHVVRGYDRVVVFFKPAGSRTLKKKDAYVAQVLKFDEVSDLALLKIDAPPVDMPVAKLGSMKDVSVGQEVHAIGHPDGETWTYTKGTVSQIRPAYKWSAEDGIEHRAGVIQTQTPINPGSSGGPLLDENGEVIGVNSFGKEGEGLNFAVTVDAVRVLLQAKGSRAAPKPQVPGWLKNSSFHDVHKNEKGVVDVVGVDTQKNGSIDFYFVKNPDGSIKYIEFLRGDGSTELRVYDTEGNGTWKTYAFYDRDGRLSLIGISEKGDGKITRYEEP
jgi:S1-C subfamily serine protease